MTELAIHFLFLSSNIHSYMYNCAKCHSKPLLFRYFFVLKERGYKSSSVFVEIGFTTTETQRARRSGSLVFCVV